MDCRNREVLQVAALVLRAGTAGNAETSQIKVMLCDSWMVISEDFKG